ncbi:methyltransferase domain-containing protein [Nocardiopsis alba]|uniref:methyltransferase domain-containing protein n=1 Tax=Nocardiopsis alba TaxID=53437 RepID=UPI0033F3DFC6
MTDLDALHAALVERLDTDDTIRAAFSAHPRHRFIPDMIWPDATGLPLFRTAEPDRWAGMVYGSGPVTTQANDGGGGPRNEPSSSSSAPQLMADMIAAVGVREGMRVLEIGTGTGWNAAVLAALVGDEGEVVSVEIDPGVAARARERLEGTGVRVLTSATPPSEEEFDAVIATCAVSRIPTEWLTAADEDAPVVLPWNPHPAVHSTPIVVLRRRGRIGAGPFVREAAFMRDRTQRSDDPPFPGLGRSPDRTSDLPVGSIELITSGLMTRLMLMLPGTRIGTGVRPFGSGHGRIVWLGDEEGSWAYVWPDGTATGGGARLMEEELANAYRWLENTGFPELSTFSLEADPGRDLYRVTCSAMEWAWEHRVSL